MDLVVKQLVHAVDPALPPASLKARLLERVRAAEKADTSAAAEKTRAPAPGPRPVSQVWKGWVASPPDAMVFASAKSEDWHEVAPGIRVRPLFVDSIEKMVTMLVEMGPGTSYPPHRHTRGEECYVIAGDLTVDGQMLRAGDYQRAGGGSMHTTQSTHDGCLLLIRSSQEDELVAGR
jgi:quercetin dioxygenase-like cupin family protein